MRQFKIRDAQGYLEDLIIFHHQDPFDRLLVAQAMFEQMPIVSADLAYDAYPIPRPW
jgi:PIN domain nuclease of toxin-antitoxin system